MTVVLEKRLGIFKVVEKSFQSRQDKHHTLKEEPVDVAHSATDDDVDVLKEVLIGACETFSAKMRSHDELRQMPKLKRCLNQDGGFQYTCMPEVRGK
jgi:hypothetical protein